MFLKAEQPSLGGYAVTTCAKECLQDARGNSFKRTDFIPCKVF